MTSVTLLPVHPAATITPPLWRGEWRQANPATMTSLTPLIWRHLPLCYDVYYDVTNPSNMTSLTPLLWRHGPLYYDVTKPATNPSTWLPNPLKKSCKPFTQCRFSFFCNDTRLRFFTTCVLYFACRAAWHTFLIKYDTDMRNHVVKSVGYFSLIVSW